MSKSKEGWLKIKLPNQSKLHRRYCIIDWHKSILFIATRADARYRDWIRLLPTVTINEFDSPLHNESNNNNLSISIVEIKPDNTTATYLLQVETRNDGESWLLALKQTAYSRNGGGIFGQSLEETYKYSPDKSSLVPLIVRQCCEHLLEYGLTFVGLFRVPGKQSAIKELRDMYDRGLSVELKETYSPATISSLLKNYLQSLPEPIIPTKYFDSFFAIGSRFKYNQTNDLHHLKQLIEMNLSSINHAVLAYLCLFLKKLTDHVQITKMDTDNLAVVFGNNLIRPAEELDLNMVKGHNYNLLPLIKGMIDHSEYIFSNNSSNQFHDSYEQTTESATKSSGFSSFSSLLSSHDHPITANSRSASMPSIHMERFSSSDSTNLSLQSQSDVNNCNRQEKSSVEKQINFISDDSNNHRSSLPTGHETDQNALFQRKQFTIRPQRFASIDRLDTKTAHESIKHDQRSMDDVSIERRQKTDIFSRPISTLEVPISIRKMDKYSSKKGLANKFGKSFSSFKSTMSKALQSHTTSTDNQSQTMDSLSSHRYLESKSVDHLSPNNSLKLLQNDIGILKVLLEQKESLILELRKTSLDERLQFENEKIELNQKIEQLQQENQQLQKQLNMQ